MRVLNRKNRLAQSWWKEPKCSKQSVMSLKWESEKLLNSSCKKNQIKTKEINDFHPDQNVLP